MNRNRVLLLLIALLAFAAQAFAQSISLKLDNVTVKEAMLQVEKQSNCTFVYKVGDIDTAKKVNVNAVSLKAAVGQILAGQTVSYEIVGKNIIIKKKAAPVASAPAKKEPAKEPGVVSGVVLDQSGQPVIGASVISKEGKWAITDAKGRFSLAVPVGSTIEVSSMGYQSQTVDVKGPGRISIGLFDEIEAIEHTVIVGYGTQRKESVVGAIAQIGTDDVVNSGLSNITQAIAGKLSGVLTMQSSGKPGENNADILVRGVSSWNGDAPLCMVDGVERDFSSIDPNEVATISVLKDASATAVFGAKGANGVILVTTRSGIKGKPQMKLTVNHSFLFPALLPKHQSSYDTAVAYNVAMMNQMTYASMFSQEDLEQFKNPSDRVKALQYPDNDWFDIMLRDVAHTTDANFNISGGSDKARYFMSMGYKHEGSIFKTLLDLDKVNYSYDRLNYRLNLDFDITPTTVLSYKVGGDISTKVAPDNSPIPAMYSGTGLLYPAYYPAWVLEEYPDWDYPEASGIRLVTSNRSSRGASYYGTPFNKLNIPSYDQNTSATLYTDLILRQDLRFITDGLSVGAKMSFNTGISRLSENVTKTIETYYLDFDYLKAGNVNPWVSNTTSTKVIENAPYVQKHGSIKSMSYSFYWEASINYDRTVKNHHVTALALFNQKENRGGAEFPYRTEGLVGRVTYDYARKYLFEGNVGLTGSEQFAPANRFGVFPSMAFGYVMSKEKWWKEAMPWWSKLKFRYSDGFVGNDKVKTGERWLYFSQYTTTTNGIIMDKVGNSTAKWETAHKQDLGVEMGWLEDRLTLNVDLFKEHRTDILVDPVVTYLIGTDYKMVNKGEMKKHGYEIEVGWNDKLDCGIKYNLSAMYSFNENRIINYEDPPYLPDYQKTAGKPYKGQQNGMSTVDGGYYNDVDDIHTYGSYTDNWAFLPVGAYKYIDYCPDGIINANDLHSVFGSKYPSDVFSFGGGLKWKGLEFSFLFYGNRGKWVDYNGSFELDMVKSEIHIGSAQADYWRPDNHGANHSTTTFGGTSGHAMYAWAGMSEGLTTNMGLVGRTWRKADYFTLRDLFLSYTFDTNKIKDKFGVSSLQLYMTGNNLLYFTSLLDANPEVSSFSSGYYPLMKTVQVGLKVGF